MEAALSRAVPNTDGRVMMEFAMDTTIFHNGRRSVNGSLVEGNYRRKCSALQLGEDQRTATTLSFGDVKNSLNERKSRASHSTLERRFIALLINRHSAQESYPRPALHQ